MRGQVCAAWELEREGNKRLLLGLDDSGAESGVGMGQLKWQ